MLVQPIHIDCFTAIASTGFKGLSAATNPSYIYTLRDFLLCDYLIAVESVGVDNLKTGSIQRSLSVIPSLWLVGYSKFKVDWNLRSYSVF